MSEVKEPQLFTVKYDLAGEFRQLAEKEGCKVQKVVEIMNCKILQYWLEIPEGKDVLISDYAFMTWIKNPVFQKYYHGTKAFEQIAEKYISERLNKEYGKESHCDEAA